MEVVLLVRPGDQEMAARLTPHAPGRLQIVPQIWPIIPQSPQLTRFVQAGIRWTTWFRQKLFRLDRRIHWLGNQFRARRFSLPLAFLVRIALAGFSLGDSATKGIFFLLAPLFQRFSWFRKSGQNLT